MFYIFAISLFFSHACSYFENFLNAASAKVSEMQGKYHFSQAELDAARKDAEKCIETASEPYECQLLLESINSFQTNEQAVIKMISQKKYKQAKGHIEICEAIAKKYSKENSPLAKKVRNYNLLILYLNPNQKSNIFDKYLNKFVDYVSSTDDKSNKIKDYSNDNGESLDKFFDNVDGFFNGVDGYMDKFGDYMDKFGDYMDKFGDFMDNLF